MILAISLVVTKAVDMSSLGISTSDLLAPTHFLK
jgi:hypothetical protein